MRESRNQTRVALLEAAAELIVRQGYRNTTHSEVTAAAFTGRTTFYEYFDSMDDLLVQLVEAWLPPWIESTLAGLPSNIPADARMAEVCSRMIHFVATDDLGRVLHDDVRCLSMAMQARIGLAHRSLSEAVTKIYQDGVSEGLFLSMPVPLAGALIDGTIMTAARTLMASDDPKGHVHETADTAVRFLLNGFRPQADGTSSEA